MISFTGRNSTTSASGAGSFTVEDAIDTASTDVLTLTHLTTAATFGGTGMGTGILLRTEDAGGNVEDAIRIRSEWTDATDGSEDSDIIFEYRRAGAALAGYTRFSPLTGFAMTVDGVGAGTTAGAALYNSTAAALGAQQYSPMMILSGAGYATGGAVSMNVRWALRGRPVQGVAAPTGQLDFMSSINAAAYTTGFSLTSGGGADFIYPGTQLAAARNVALSVTNDHSVAGAPAAQQVSGMLRFRGYDTADATVDFGIQCVPTTAAGFLQFFKSIGGAAYGAAIASISEVGTMTLLLDCSIGSNFWSSSTDPALYASGADRRFRILGNRSAASTTEDVSIRSQAVRTAGRILEICNTTTVLGGMAWDGQLTAVSVASAKGANVASAGDLPMLRDGDTFHVTGVTTVNGLPASNHASYPRQAGSTVWLIFDGVLTVKHNTAPSATWAKILLAGSVDLLTAADTRLELKYDGTSWYEMSRTVA
ncbi:MAG: hypothetical protein WC700_17785 [Gemmatimonadaceae bacterium]